MWFHVRKGVPPGSYRDALEMTLAGWLDRPTIRADRGFVCGLGRMTRPAESLNILIDICAACAEWDDMIQFLCHCDNSARETMGAERMVGAASLSEKNTAPATDALVVVIREHVPSSMCMGRRPKPAPRAAGGMPGDRHERRRCA